MQLIDGGLSTQLVRRGASVDDPLWTGRVLLDNPGLVELAHRDFIDAGAHAVLTASYQISREGFLRHGMTAQHADDALAKSVQVARAATHPRSIPPREVTESSEPRALVAASVGPYGAISHDGAEYRGNYDVSVDELTRFHRGRLDVLVAAEPDVLAIETIPDLLEAHVLADVLAEFPAIPKWFSFTCADGAHLWAGATIEQAVEVVARIPGLQAVGVNCVEPSLVTQLARRIRTVTDLPMIAYPNRGGTWDSKTGEWVGAKPESLAHWVPEWQDAGVAIVGGCCGASAVDIAEVRDVLSTR